MTFTDDDLKRLKANGKLFDVRWCWTMDALLSRLEAAENCIPYHECHNYLSTCPHLEAWQKAAGVRYE
jgi:hypothetical protein